MPIALWFTLSLAAQLLPTAPAADLTLPPESARIVLIAEGRGSQVYSCNAQAGVYTWKLTGPDAQLFNLATGKPIGHHTSGPTWSLDDGSTLTGAPLASRPADTPADVPWLLLRATPGSNPTQTTTGTGSGGGVLAPVTLVRRYNTHGGIAPPAGCDAEHLGATQKVPYTATYAFYTEGPSLTRP